MIKLLNRRPTTRHVVRVSNGQPQGQHGIKPPLEALEEEATEWLNTIASDVEEVLELELQVECRRIPGSRSFNGLVVICRPEYNPNSLQVRIRPKPSRKMTDDQSRYHWLGHLVHDDPQRISDILMRARPAAQRHLDEHDPITTLTKDVPDGPEAIVGKQKRERAKTLDQALQYTRALKKRAFLQKLCAALHERSDCVAGIGYGAVCQEISRLMNVRFENANINQALVNELVKLGLLEPVTGIQNQVFLPTVLFGEYVEDQEEVRRQERIEQLSREVATLTKLRDAALREKDRYLRHIDDLERAVAHQNERLADTHETLRALGASA